MVKATAVSPRAFSARLRKRPSTLGARLAGADHVAPFGIVAACTTWILPFHNVHAAVTLPFGSTATGTIPVIATPPIVPCASVVVVQMGAPAGLTATCIFCCGDGMV